MSTDYETGWDRPEARVAELEAALDTAERNAALRGTLLRESVALMAELERERDEFRQGKLSAEEDFHYSQARVAELEAALREIRDREGKVCDNYELCDHRACRSSYGAWAIADAAVSSGEPKP